SPMRSSVHYHIEPRAALSLLLWIAVVTSPIRLSATGHTPPNSLRTHISICRVHQVRTIAQRFLPSLSNSSVGLSRGNSRPRPLRPESSISSPDPRNPASLLSRHHPHPLRTTPHLRC